jgi:hypothetical protein
MDQESFAIASGMLRSLISGNSCDTIAREHELTKSAVSQRIRVLASALQRVVGVVDVDEDASPTASLIRQHGAAYLEALDHFVPQAAPALRNPFCGTADHIALYVAKIAQHSRTPLRDTALLHTLFTTAAKPLEIAQMEVRDYLDEGGNVREHSTLRAAIATNRQPRPLEFDQPDTVRAIDAYLDERLGNSGYSTTGAPYRGLAPCSRLFLTREGKPMRVVLAGPGGQHQVCKEIHEIFRRILAYGGMSGMNTASARRIAAHALRNRGANPEEIGQALGLQKLAVYKLLRHVDDPRSLAHSFGL